MRLIDADALLDALERKRWYEGADELSATVAVVDAPAIDAVPVVRCNDCKHWIKSSFFKGKQDKTLGQCDCNLLMRDADFFCKSGERKDDA